MEFQIRLNSMEDVVKWVNRMEHYGCQAEAWMGSLVIDASSLMGLVGLGIGKLIKVVIHSELKEDLCEELQEFIAA